MINNSITPIFIIGASRNGTTSLVNAINGFPEVAAIEHELHHGGHEAKLHAYHKYYGGLSNNDSFIDFLYNYASEDYFQLANGNIEYHLKKKRTNFFEFYFDLVDRFAVETGKNFWLAKIESSFFTDQSSFKLFLDLVKARYKNVKFVSIQRDLLSAVNSAQYMEGRAYNVRRKLPFKYYYLLAYTQSYFKTYAINSRVLDKKEILHLNFHDFINNNREVIFQLREYLGLEKVYKISEKKYKPNTSFVKNKRKDLSGIDKTIVRGYFKLLKLVPGTMILAHKLNSLKKPRNPMYRKLIKYKYFKEDFKSELIDTGAHGLVVSVKDDVN